MSPPAMNKPRKGVRGAQVAIGVTFGRWLDAVDGAFFGAREMLGRQRRRQLGVGEVFFQCRAVAEKSVRASVRSIRFSS